LKQVSFPEIPHQEFQERRAKAKKFMAEAEMDAMLLLCIENIYYYTGFRKTWPFHWLHAAVFPLDGDPALIVPQISHKIAEKTSYAKEVRPFGGDPAVVRLPQDAVELVLDAMRDMGLSKKTIGLELNGPAMYTAIFPAQFDEIRSGLPKAKFVNCTDLIWKMRMVKTSWETEAVRKACEITMKGFKAGLETVREGVSELEVLKAIYAVFIAEGAVDTPLEAMMCIRGGVKDYDMSTSRPVDRKLTRGRQLFFDGGACYKGYRIDVQREACIGKPSQLERKLVEWSMKGQEAGEKAFQPGIKVSEVHKATMSVLGRVPLDLRAMGVEHAVYHTFMGHGEGLAIHEPPWITGTEDTVLEPGMVLSLEAGALDIPKHRELGFYPEDLYLITKVGCENLTGNLLPRELWVVK